MPRTETRLDPATLIELLAVDTPADETDVRILQTAAQAIVRHGPSAFEVDDIASASGVGRSTIYRRFGDRNGLLVASLAHEVRRLLDQLAEAAAPIDDLVEEIVAAFCAGVRFAKVSGLAGLARRDPILLHLLTVDSAPLVAAAAEHLAELAHRRDPRLDPVEAHRSAEILIRLAVSFTLAPATALATDGDVAEGAVRRHVAGLVAAVGGQPPAASESSSVVAAPTS